MADAEELKARLNAETGRVSWSELERHFARGALVTVRRGLDLVEVAAAFVEDDRNRVSGWMETGAVRTTSASDAQRWVKRDPTLWAVVVAPWVLVQEAGKEAD
ncbi:MAG TPA: DUF2288 domain-containing protein [Gammaproteobacteria bacterium]|nr:DUF2288 domain-containing protein [Gammaproteobacteria bacterium]